MDVLSYNLNEVCLPEEKGVEQTYVLIFKTDIRYKKDVKVIFPFLTSCPDIIHWNVDLQDCDKILRVELNNANTAIIRTHLNGLGYFCEELPD
jgi:hypothetical protein